MGHITAYAAGGSNSHLADIEKLSNGYVVRFQKPQKVTVKQRSPGEALGFDNETLDIVRTGLEHLKEIKAGESWKKEAEAVLAKPESPSEKWITVGAALACKDEKELIEAIREAVIQQAQIEKLFAEGEFGPGIC